MFKAHTSVLGHEKKIKLVQTWKLPPSWIAFIKLEDAMEMRKLINNYTRL